MQIDQGYINTLLKPLNNSAIPTLKEYLEELENLGINLEDENQRIDRKFEIHLLYLSSRGIISNAEGDSDLKSMGFVIGCDKNLAIVGSNYIMKNEQETYNPQPTISIGSIQSQMVQVGNNNSQTATINMQQLCESIAKSDDEQAKSLLTKLLENNTVAGVIGAATSGLITILTGA